MTELKTLKDIKGIYSNGNKELGELHINKRELRQEAIKWIKHNNSISSLDEVNRIGSVCQNAWIKHFFNIEEEELK